MGSILREEKLSFCENIYCYLNKEDELYVAQCPEVGTASHGDTIEEAVANLKEATELYLEEFPMPNVSRIFVTTFEAGYLV